MVYIHFLFFICFDLVFIEMLFHVDYDNSNWCFLWRILRLSNFAIFLNILEASWKSLKKEASFGLKFCEWSARKGKAIGKEWRSAEKVIVSKDTEPKTQHWKSHSIKSVSDVSSDVFGSWIYA